MQQRFSHVYWLGGSPCAGKSSIADQLAASHGMQVYRCDDAYFRHQELITPARHPLFWKLSRASCDELWMRPVARQVAEERALYREEFPLIVADLDALPRTSPIIAEGAALLPELVDGLHPTAGRAVWVVPTDAFQRRHSAGRAWRHDVLRDCTDPEHAWRNWMARDAGFAGTVARDAERRGYPLLTVDGSRPLAHSIDVIERHFGL